MMVRSLRTNDDYLFNRESILDVLARLKARVAEAVDTMDGNGLLSSSTDDLVELVASMCTLDVPKLLRDQAHVDEPTETTIRMNDYGREIHVPATSILLNVPFTGDKDVFDYQPSTYTLSPPRATIAGNVLYIRVTGVDLTNEAVDKELKNRLDEIEKHLATLRNDVAQLDAQVKPLARQLIEARRTKLLGAKKMASSLSFPLKPRGGAQTYYVPTVRKKIVTRPPPSKPSEPFKPEPALDEKQYQEILTAIAGMAQTMERSASAFVNMDEETLRTQFLVPLNAMFEGAATGETFNAAGKTDILIREQDRNIFIAECKFWRGPKSITDAIEQLLSYLTWRDTKAALIVFNRNRDFSNVLKAMKETIEANPHKKRGPVIESETRFRYVFGNPTDAAREITLTVLAFDLPVPSTQAPAPT